MVQRGTVRIAAIAIMLQKASQSVDSSHHGEVPLQES